MGDISYTAAGIITGYSNQFGAITGVAKGILCLAQDGLSGIFSALNAVAGEIIAGLLGFVGTVISRSIEAITGVIGAQLAAINAFVQDIAQTVALIIAVLTSLDDLAKNTLAFLLDGQNCQFNAAELGRCLVGQILGNLTKKETMNLYAGSQAYNDKVLQITSGLLGPETAINKFIGKSQMFANKARIQQTL